MNFEYFFARRITFKTQRRASALVVFLSIASIALAVAAMEIALSFVQGFETEIQNKVVGFGSHIQIGNYYRELDTQVVPLPEDEPSLDSIRKLPYVVSVSPYLQRWAVIKTGSGWDGVLLKGVGKDYDWRFFSTVLKEGSIPAFGSMDSSGPAPILISRKQARRLELALGDRVRLLFLPQPVRRRPAVVAGIYETGLEEFDASIVVCDKALLQDIWGFQPNEVSGFEVNLTSLDHIEEGLARINELTPHYFGAEPITELFQEIFAWLNLQHQNVWVILALMTIVAMINMTTVELILIIERIRTVGILKSMGMPSKRVQRMFVWYAFFLILIGVVTGNLLGLGLLASQDRWGWLRVNQEDYFIEVVPVAWVWGRFLLVNLGVILACTLFMFVPTLVVNRISPLKAVRFE